MSDDLDADINAARSAKAAPVWGMATSAAEESARRNPTSTLWTDRRRCVGYYPFFLKAGTSQNDIIVLASPKIFVVHSFIIGWVNKGGSFPERWYGPCDKWRLPDPGQAGFAPTGKPCAACLALGEPKSIAVLPLTYKQEWTDRKGRTYKWKVCPLIVDQAGALNQLRDQASLQKHGDLKFCLMKISRSAGDRTPRIGDSFTVIKTVSEEAVKKVGDIVDLMREFDAAKGFAPLGENMARALMLHKKLSDRFNGGDDYDPKGMDKALRGDLSDDLGSDLPDDAPASGATTAASSLDALDDLSDDDGVNFDDAGETAAAPPAKETAAPTAAKPTAPKSAPPAADPWA